MKIANVMDKQILVELSEKLGYRVEGAPQEVLKKCKICGQHHYFSPEKEPICYMCWEDVERDNRIKAWYAAGPVINEDGSFLFQSYYNPSVKGIIKAKDCSDALDKAKSQFDLGDWYGCSIKELNEYRMDGDQYSFGPKTNFLCNAIREFYES